MRPDTLVLVCGTGTEVGKTWVASRLLGELRSRGLGVAARKPAQSFDVDLSGVRLGGATDAEVLGEASGEPAGTVCHAYRSYHRAMAPPMAAEALGLPAFTVADLVSELVWPDRGADVGVVELAGGVRSPQASDGDGVDVARAVRPDRIVLVGDAGLGTVNAVRMSLDALGTISERGADLTADARGVAWPKGVPHDPPTLVVLDRYDERHDLHRRNRQWLAEREGIALVTLPGEEAALADFVTGSSR